MKLLHPFMPFITEEIWHELNERDTDDCVVIASWPKPTQSDAGRLTQVARIFEVVTQIRNLRSQTQTPPREKIGLYIKTSKTKLYQNYQVAICKLAGINEIQFCDSIPDHHGSNFVIREDEFLLLTSQETDPSRDKDALQKELEYTRGFLASVVKKLNNQRFVDNAPEQVVINERKKREDAEAKIKTLEESLSKL